MLYLKALHIIFIVTWFAGLFYIVRLFVYHTEAQGLQEPDKSVLSRHFAMASRRLWLGITWPSAVLTYIFGFWLLSVQYHSGIPDWLWLKLLFVMMLTVYQIICHLIFRKFQKGIFSFSGMQMRLWNEVATILLFVIVFIVVLKDLSNWLWGLAGLLVFTALLYLAILVYKKARGRNL